MRRLKTALWAALALAVLVVGAVVIVAATFDPNRHKDAIVEQVRAATGRTLAIEGGIRIAWWPPIGAAVSGVSLSEPQQPGAVFARAREARVSLEIVPLLARRLVVDSIALEGLDVTFVTRRDGTTNVDDLLRAREPAASDAKVKPPAKAASAPPALAVGRVKLRNSTLGWRDERNGRQAKVAVTELTTGRIESDAPGDLKVDARIVSSNPNLALQATGRAGYRVDFARGALTANEIDLAIKGSAAGFTGLDGTLKGALAWDPQARRLHVAGLRAQLRSTDGLAAEIDAPQLSIAPERTDAKPARAEIRVTRSGRMSEAKLALGATQGKGDVIEWSGLVLAFESRGGGGPGVVGELTTPLRIDLGASQARLVRIAGRLAIPGDGLPQPPPSGTFAGVGAIDWSKERVDLDLRAKFDGSDIKLEVNLAGWSRRALGFDLVADRLDLDRYVSPRGAKPGAGAPTPSTQPSGGAAKPATADPGALRTLEANGQVRINALTVSRVRMENVRAGLRASGGRIELSPFAANVYQGTVAGNAIFNVANNQFASRQQFAGVAIGPLLRDLASRDIVEGRADVLLDLTGAGSGLDAIKRTLAGDASLRVRDGALKGIDLVDIARRARALRRGAAEDVTATRAEKTDFGELTASFVIRSGVARNEDLAMRSPFVRVTGAGSIDLGANTLEYRTRAMFTGDATGQGAGETRGPDPRAGRGLTVPITIEGALDAPRYRVDYGAIATEALKDEVRRRIEDAAGGSAEDKVRERMEERLKGRVGDALKGILGR